MTDVNTFSVITYSLAGLVSLLLALLLLTGWRGRLQGGLLAFTSFATATWAFVFAYAARGVALSSSQVMLVEFAHDSAWLVFLATLLSGALGDQRLQWARFGSIGIGATLLVIAAWLEISGPGTVTEGSAGSLLVFGSILTAICVLALIEQIYRNARETQRRGLKYLAIGVGGIFAFDIFLYSNAIVAGQISELFWALRGLVVALCIPFVGVAAHRSPQWSVGIFVSRQVVFYSATVFGAGVYLTIVGAIGYYLSLVGGDWGAAAQLIFFGAGSIGLFLFLFSDRVRTRARVFISKHFFENRYDYREEWLRLIKTLTESAGPLPLQKRAIRALAQIVESPSGLLWLSRDSSESFECVAGWNIATTGQPIGRDQSIIQFIETTGWLIEMSEYRSNPDRYKSLEFHSADLGVPDLQYIIPLIHTGQLIGFVALSSPATVTHLNYEDRDLLKTAGMQIASYLSQEMATEQLAEHKQFETFNRLTAFLMHDLKNLIAQQSLVVENAQKHKSNPEFVDDVISTVQNSVGRLRRVIDHLQQGSKERPQQNVEVSKLLMQAVSQCADRKPEPRASIIDAQVRVRADRDRLLMAIVHAIRNAQDATSPDDGSVQVSAEATDTQVRISIVDNGVGMDREFIRERLFRPFDSTKGTHGMGIGAYQLRETIRQIGGQIDVTSEPGSGTSVVLTLERVARAEV